MDQIVSKQTVQEKLLSLRKDVIEQMNAGKIDKARETIKTIENLLEGHQLTDINEQFLIFSILAKFYKQINNYDKAASYSQHALNIVQKVDEKHTKVVI